jgi:hypothetical protein
MADDLGPKTLDQVAEAAEISPTDLSVQDQLRQTLSAELDVKLSKTGLQLPEGLPYDKWLGLIKTLFTFQKTVQWAIGDALLYGGSNYRDPAFDSGNRTTADRYSYEIVSKLTGYPVGQLYDIASVCRQVPISLRNEALSFSHHRAVRSLSPERQTHWLKTAADLGLSVEMLRYEIGVSETDGFKVLDIHTDERLLPPPTVQPDSEQPPVPSPKPKKWPKGLETHLTGFEMDALKVFAAEKHIDPDQAVRALVTIGLYASGHLQKVHSGESVFDAEVAYLIWLGERLFADRDKFTIERLSDDPLITDERERPPSPFPNISKSLIAQKDQYIKMCASILTKNPDLTVSNVQTSIGGNVPKKYAEHILAEAKKVVAATQTAPSNSDKAATEPNADGGTTAAEFEELMDMAEPENPDDLDPNVPAQE